MDKNMDKNIDSNLELIKTWLETQNTLPQDIDELILRRFILSSEDIEACKKRLKNNYLIRNANKHIFFNRDILSEDIRTGLDCLEFAILPGYTPKTNSKIIYASIRRVEDWNFQTFIRIFSMISDILYVNKQDFGVNLGIIIDMDVICFAIIKKLSINLLKLLIKFLTESSPVVYTEIHYLNCSALVKLLSSIVNPLLKKEIRNLIHYHDRNSETLFDFVPKDMLPYELGGTAGNLTDMKNEIVRHAEAQREYLLDDRHWEINEIEAKGGKNMN